MQTPRFSRQTVPFLKRAGRQKRLDWLERNRAEYEKVLQAPFTQLARDVALELRPLAPDYHFPIKGIGRLKRAANRVAEHGGGPFKDWISYSAARPRTSRFEHNPNLFFLINSEDPDDSVLVAGGLYMPSSKQIRAIREAIGRDASAFDALFASKEFSKRFRGGFSKEKSSRRPPRGFDPDHPRMEWLKLQAFFVWRPYTKREFISKSFSALVARDFKQILRLNRILEKILVGDPIRALSEEKPPLLRDLQDLDIPRKNMDF